MGNFFDRRVWKHLVRTPTSMSATLHGYEFQVWLDKEIPDRFYAIVTSPDGSYAVDGWCDENVTNLEDAVRWARRGACI